MAGNNETLAVGAKFFSYSSFKKALDKYQKDTVTQFITTQGEKIPQSDPLYERFQYANLRLQCKQGKRYKKAEPTKDQRPCQRSFKVGCPVQLTLRLNRRPKDAPCLKITQLNLDHAGHEVSKQVFQLYPEQRRILVDEVDRTVLGATTMKTSEQRKILEERHSVPIMRHSVYNMQQKMGVGRVNGERDDVKCEALIRDIVADGGHGEVGRDDEGAFQYCCFTTKVMRDVLNLYPETLILDCTYKCNQYLYPCMTIMVLDGEGQGQPVFHAFVAREDKNILENCLHVFARQYTTANTCCFVVDKDMAEIAAIGAVFPGVPVLLCHFHISQAVERYLKGKLSRATADIVLDSFMSQVTTESEDEFLHLKNNISQIVPQPVVTYLEENWWSKRHLWAACCNINVVRLHATTTNALESYHAKIKKHVNDKFSLSNAISALVHFDHDKLTEARRKRLLSANSNVYDHRDQDATSIKITKLLSRFGAQLVKVELELSGSVGYEVIADQTGGFTVSYKDRQHITTETTCSCSTFGHLKIPCRHIFTLRKHLNIELFDLDIVPARFQQSQPVVQNPPSVSDEPISDLLVTTIPAVPFSLRTVEGRYKAAKVVCDRAASFLSILGCVEFQQKLRELEEFIQRWSVICDAEVNSEPVSPLNVHSPPVPIDNLHHTALSDVEGTAGELLCVIDLQANTVEFPHSPQSTVSPVNAPSPTFSSSVLTENFHHTASTDAGQGTGCVVDLQANTVEFPHSPQPTVSPVPVHSPPVSSVLTENFHHTASSDAGQGTGCVVDLQANTVEFPHSPQPTVSPVPVHSPPVSSVLTENFHHTASSDAGQGTGCVVDLQANTVEFPHSPQPTVSPVLVHSPPVSSVLTENSHHTASSDAGQGTGCVVDLQANTVEFLHSPQPTGSPVLVHSPTFSSSIVTENFHHTASSDAGQGTRCVVDLQANTVKFPHSPQPTVVPGPSMSVASSEASSSCSVSIAPPSVLCSAASTCLISVESPSMLSSVGCPLTSVPSCGVEPTVSDESGPSTSETSCSWPTMSRLLKPRGRPCSKQRFTTKLSTKKRRKCIPKIFNELSEADKTSLLLRSVSVFNHKPSRLIQTEDLKSVMTFSDTVLDDKVELGLIQDSFDSAAWALVVEGVEHRKSYSTYFCGDCRDLDNGEFKMVQCERCLIWYHFECVSYSSKKKVQTWFCDDCCQAQ